MLAEHIGLNPYFERRIALHRTIINGTDTPPLAPAGTELSRSSRWIADLFDVSNNAAMQYIPGPMRRWSINERRRYWENAQNPQTRELVKRKIYHAYNVNNMSYELALQSQEYGWNIAQVQVNADLHDAARAPQAFHYTTFRDPDSFDHADVGAEMAAQAHLPFAAFSCDEGLALDAVAYHSGIECPDNPYFNLLRDADKLVICGEVVADLQEEIANGPIKPSVILEEAMEQFKAKENIRNGHAVKTPATRLLQRIGWIYDLNFHPTRMKFIESGRPQQFLELLRVLTGSPNPGIEEAVYNWQEEVLREENFTKSLQIA